MKKKIIFLIAFVPVHYFSTLLLMQRYLFNYNPNVDTGLLAELCRVLAWAFTLPVILPMITLGLLHEYQPLWLQILPGIINSLAWGIAILLLCEGIKRLCAKKAKGNSAEPAMTA
jgi:hypothetical protein